MELIAIHDERGTTSWEDLERLEFSWWSEEDETEMVGSRVLAEFSNDGRPDIEVSKDERPIEERETSEDWFLLRFWTFLEKRLVGIEMDDWLVEEEFLLTTSILNKKSFKYNDN